LEYAGHLLKKDVNNARKLNCTKFRGHKVIYKDGETVKQNKKL